MNRILLMLIISFSFNSCASEYEMPGYRFSNFENTPVWELAKAVKADDGDKIREILVDKKSNIDFKDPVWKQTLLTLAIVNQKKNAFIALLAAGANPNELTGKHKDSTPFADAILYQDNCDLFYIENLLKHKVDINKYIVPENIKENFSFTAGCPLLIAVDQYGNDGNECLNIIKFLVENGADINCCFENASSGICEGVLTKSLISTNMEVLKYFIIEKNIKIPDPVFVKGIDENTQAYSLEEFLNAEDFEDWEDENGKHDRSNFRNIRSQILTYLANKK